MSVGRGREFAAGGTVEISARSNSALARFWTGLLCITVLGLGAVELMVTPGGDAEKVTRTASAAPAHAISQQAERVAPDETAAKPAAKCNGCSRELAAPAGPS